MLFLALATATLALHSISPKTQARVREMRSQFKQGLQTETQADVDACACGNEGLPAGVKVTKGESLETFRQALMKHFESGIQAAEKSRHPNAAVEHLYEAVRHDDHYPTTTRRPLAATELVARPSSPYSSPYSYLSKDEKLAIIGSKVVEYAAGLTQQDIDTNAKGFNPEYHVTAGTPVEQVRQRMLASLPKTLKLAASNEQFADVLYTEMQQMAPASAETADQLYKRDVARNQYAQQHGGFSGFNDEQNAKAFSHIFEQLKEARDNNDVAFLKLMSTEG